MSKVVEILMSRDDLTKKEAEELVRETKNALLESSPWEAEEIIADYLGLEPDYLMDILLD